MAATILNSARAVEVSVFVVRAFVQVRELLGFDEATPTAIAERLRQIASIANLVAWPMTAERK